MAIAHKRRKRRKSRNLQERLHQWSLHTTNQLTGWRGVDGKEVQPWNERGERRSCREASRRQLANGRGPQVSSGSDGAWLDQRKQKDSSPCHEFGWNGMILTITVSIINCLSTDRTEDLASGRHILEEHYSHHIWSLEPDIVDQSLRSSVTMKRAKGTFNRTNRLDRMPWTRPEPARASPAPGPPDSFAKASRTILVQGTQSRADLPTGMDVRV